MHDNSTRIPWLNPGDTFPSLDRAWGRLDPAPGLLAAGGDLSTQTLERAYRQGIFPWFSLGQPILWWSPDPRMVLETAQFKVHPSLRKTIRRFKATAGCEIHIDRDFERVIRSCASTPRQGQQGTWIVPDMIGAYENLHAQGLAHSVETWIDGELAGGLYCVNLGNMVFGESMFAHRRDASKIALAALVALCRRNQIDLIDCQQNTAHLASLGAREMQRLHFQERVRERVDRAAPQWTFEPIYWSEIV
jgi:leucyl/phenylalanyl-tRNA--protein transferase